jgi:excisionase family DNA binding protein
VPRLREVADRRGNPKVAHKIVDLQRHPHVYVGASDLARYWGVSRKQIYKQIAAGTLRAIRVGSRLLRIRTAEAIRFEASAKMSRLPERRIPPQRRRTIVLDFQGDRRQRRRTNKK